jgi:hypothetical protein
MLLILFMLLICTYQCEKNHIGISGNLRQIWQRIAGFDDREIEMEMETLIVSYIPLGEDSQWYNRKPTPELAEDCQLC